MIKLSLKSQVNFDKLLSSFYSITFIKKKRDVISKKRTTYLFTENFSDWIVHINTYVYYTL